MSVRGGAPLNTFAFAHADARIVRSPAFGTPSGRAGGLPAQTRKRSAGPPRALLLVRDMLSGLRWLGVSPAPIELRLQQRCYFSANVDGGFVAIMLESDVLARSDLPPATMAYQRRARPGRPRPSWQEHPTRARLGTKRRLVDLLKLREQKFADGLRVGSVVHGSIEVNADLVA